MINIITLIVIALLLASIWNDTSHILLGYLIIAVVYLGYEQYTCLASALETCTSEATIISNLTGYLSVLTGLWFIVVGVKTVTKKFLPRAG